MIISHKHKFIFLKTNKTAGTSVEIALSKFCGPSDIITPISAEDEKTRKELGYPGPQNYIPYSKYSFQNAVRWITKGTKKEYYNHIPAKEVKELIGDQIWNSYYKFCIERNPWDRCISLYYWRCKTEPRPTISEFLDSDTPLALKQKGFDIYTIDGEVVVDHVCRFENLSNDLEGVLKHLGIDEKLELPHAKAKTRKDKRSYQEILQEDEKSRIEDLFSKEIQLFGYEW